MKGVSGTLKISLAQYRDLEAFAMFASDLDAASKQQLARGARLTELLKQGQAKPMPFEEQVVSIWAGTKGKLDEIEVEDILEFEERLHEFLRHNGTILETIRETRKFSPETEAELETVIENVKRDYFAEKQKDAVYDNNGVIEDEAIEQESILKSSK